MAITFPLDPVIDQEHAEGGGSWKWNAKSVWDRGAGPPATLISMIPDSAYSTFDQDILVELTGTNFKTRSTIYYDNAPLSGGYVDADTMRFMVNGVNEPVPRDVPIRVDNSISLQYYFLPRPPDSPAVTEVIPNIVWTMNPAATMRILGTGFETVSTVMLQAPNNGAVTAQVTTFVSATELTIWFDGPNAQTGTWLVYVNTPGADAPDSNKVTLNVSA